MKKLLEEFERREFDLSLINFLVSSAVMGLAVYKCGEDRQFLLSFFILFFMLLSVIYMLVSQWKRI